MEALIGRILISGICGRIPRNGGGGLWSEYEDMKDEHLKNLVEDDEEEEERLECFECGYRWTPRRDDPAQCPRCSSRDWKHGG